MANENDAREAALTKWLSEREYTKPEKHAFRAGYDAARAECERKVVELESLVSALRNELSRDMAVSGEDRAEKAEARVRELTNPPDYGIEHKLLCEWVNSLPEPFRTFVTRLETDANPSGNIRDAICQRENAEALAARVRELECWGNDCHAQWTAAESALATAREQNAALRATVERVIERVEQGNPSTHWVIGQLRAALASAPAPDAEAGDARCAFQKRDGYCVNDGACPRWVDGKHEYSAAPAPEVHIAVSPEAVDECLEANPPPRAECTAEELRRALLDACTESHSPWLRVSAVVDALVEVDRRAAKKGTEP